MHLKDSATERHDSMRWVMARHEGADRVGLVENDQIHLLPSTGSLVDLLGDDGEKLQTAAAQARTDPFDVLDFAGADLGPPIRPPQLRDFLTFIDHLRNIYKMTGTEISGTWEHIPAFYFSNSTGVLGPYDPVPVSPGCEQFDYELEIAAVIGKDGTNLPVEDADSHIAGFMILNDWSARDLQLREMDLGLGPSKSKDGYNTLGPMFVTKDELEPHRQGNSYHLEMKGYVNDELVSHGFMDQMDWSWAEVISYASRGTTLRTGEVIGSGTVPTGCLLEHFAIAIAEGGEFRGWLEPGDVVTFEVQGLGTTRQTVQPAPEWHRLRTGF